jgi:hypothetical protein
LNATFAVPTTGAIAVADLVLVRYALPNATPKKIQEDVGKLIDAGLSAAEFDDVRAELASAGFLSKGRRNTFAPTDAGRRQALQILGLSELPPGMNWGIVLAKHLFPPAAGLSGDAAAKLDKGDKLAAFLLKRKYGLSSVAGSSVKQVLEAIVCKECDFPQETTLDGLLRAVLSKLVESPERLTKEQLAKQLPLVKTGLSKVSAEEVRRSIVRDWLTCATKTRPRDQPSPAEPFDLAAFAATVRALAAGSPSEDRFYDNKVFIAPLWRRSQREPNFPRLSLLGFKQRLIEANAKHFLHLSRADLVQAMDPRLVAESETAHLNATFHFVVLEESRP